MINININQDGEFDLDLGELTFDNLKFAIEKKKDILGCEKEVLLWKAQREYWSFRKEKDIKLHGKIKCFLDKNLINFLSNQDSSERCRLELQGVDGDTHETISYFTFSPSLFINTRPSGNKVGLEYGGFIKLTSDEDESDSKEQQNVGIDFSSGSQNTDTKDEASSDIETKELDKDNSSSSEQEDTIKTIDSQRSQSESGEISLEPTAEKMTDRFVSQLGITLVFVAIVVIFLVSVIIFSPSSKI